MPSIKSLKKPAKRIVHDNFYNGRPWRRVRALKLSEEPRDEVLLRQGKAVIANTVDHRLSRRFWPHLQYDLGNLISMTEATHAKKRGLESRITTKEQYINVFGANGERIFEIK